MNTVEPIKEYDLIEDIQEYLKARSERDYVLFSTGIYAPVRISDILPLKVRDIKDKAFISLREIKTGNEQLIAINDDLKIIFAHYTEGKKGYEYLFPSRKKNSKGIHGPITRQQAYNIFNSAAKHFGLERIGCHSTRKTFGYHYYQQMGDIVTLQEIYKHSDISITKRYIGLTQETKDNAIKTFKYKNIRK